MTVTCNHKYRTTITPASAKKSGRKQVKCSKCRDKTITKIYAAEDITLSKTFYARNGKRRKPSVIVRDGRGKTESRQELYGNLSQGYGKCREIYGSHQIQRKLYRNGEEIVHGGSKSYFHKADKAEEERFYVDMEETESAEHGL